MKKIIDGLKYDTETAEKIHFWDNGKPSSDFYAHDETLYRSKKGRYFVCGWSGAAGPYSVSAGSNARGEGSRLLPLSDGEAFLWLVEHGADEKAEELFPERIEDA